MFSTLASAARGFSSAVIVATVIAAGLSATAPHVAHAQQETGATATSAEDGLEGIWLTSRFPAFTAQNDKKLSIDLALTNKNLPPQRVELGVTGLPDGWQWRIEGGGRPVTAAIAASDETVDLSLNVTPPADAEIGTYNLVVTGRRSDGESLKLPLAFTLTKAEPARLTLEPKLPALRGTVRSTFDYQVALTNEGQEETTVNLLSKAPPGFEVTFQERYGSQELTSLPVKAGESKDLTVSVDPPEKVAAGQYPVMIRAAGGDIAAESRLTLDITGSASLGLSGPGGRLSGDAVAGEARTFTFTLQNTGTAPARAVGLSARPPSGWKVEFDPEQIEELAPGQSTEVAVSMTPGQQAVAGDYMVTVRASGEGASDSADFRVTVRTATVWGIVGLGVIAAAVVVLGFAVTRYGRR